MSLVKLIPSQESVNDLNEYLQHVRLPARDEFHTTIFYTEETPIFKTPFLEEKLRSPLPVRLDPITYSLQIFGDSTLVLGYNNAVVEEISNFLIGESLRQCILAYSDIRTLDEEGVPDSLSAQDLDILKLHTFRRRNSPIYPLNPHITLSKNFHGRHSALQVPQFLIIMEQINWEEEF